MEAETKAVTLTRAGYMEKCDKAYGCVLSCSCGYRRQLCGGQELSAKVTGAFLVCKGMLGLAQSSVHCAALLVL